MHSRRRNYLRINLDADGPAERAIVKHLAAAVPNDGTMTARQHRRAESHYLKNILHDLLVYGAVPDGLSVTAAGVAPSSIAESTPSQPVRPEQGGSSAATASAPKPPPAPIKDDAVKMAPPTVASASSQMSDRPAPAGGNDLAAEDDDTPLDMLGPEDLMGGLFGGADVG